MQSAVVWWAEANSNPLEKLPIRELIEHAQQNRWIDETISFICIGGSDSAFSIVDAYLTASGIPSHDFRMYARKMGKAFPWLEKTFGRFFNCFIRWLALREFASGSPVISWDADIFLNCPLSFVHESMRDITGTAGSSCFAAISDQDWFDCYENELRKMETQQDSYLSALQKDYQKLHLESRLGGSFDSVFGRRIASELQSDSYMLQTFYDTPEEIFIDRLIRTHRLQQDWYMQTENHLVCPQLLTLPELPWVTSDPNIDKQSVNSPFRFRQKGGRYFVNDTPLLFVHFQGAIYRLCAAYLVTEARSEQPKDRLKSSLHPGDLPGSFAEDILARYWESSSDQLRLQLDLCEASVARRFFLGGSLEEVLNSSTLDHANKWA